MYLFEAKGEAAFELMADLFDPISELVSDEKFVKCVQTGQKAKAVKFAMKEHSKELRQLLAICNNVPVEEYNKTAPEMLVEIMQALNHPMVADLFTSQGQTSDENNTGSATESIKEDEK
jgi:hypothetical protein